MKDTPLLLASWVWDFVTLNWALISIAVTVILLVVIPEMVMRKYLRLIINIFDDTPPPFSAHMRDYAEFEGEPVDFRALDGHRLWGMLIRGDATQPARGMIIFATEFKSAAGSCARYCTPLVEAGFDVFSFDFRGHGQSADEEGYRPRQWPSDREVSDMLGAIAYVEDYLERSGRPPEVALFGISRGAGAAILAAQSVPNIKAIITDGAFSSDSTMEYFMKRWAKIFARVRVVYENHPPVFWRFLRWRLFRACGRRFNCTYPSVRKALAGLGSVPILLIHGEKDSYIPVAQTQMLYDCADDPKYMWIVPRAKHNQSVVVHPQEYAANTVHFFQRYLAGMEVDPSTDRLLPLRRLTQPLTQPPQPDVAASAPVPRRARR
ncbi:MAG: alpha/beta fold hydrolase [bacterium]|nr:alpha/beta fold hydrolase [bacterium]